MNTCIWSLFICKNEKFVFLKLYNERTSLHYYYEIAKTNYFLNYLYLIDFGNREIPLRKIRSNNNRGKLRFAMNQTIFFIGKHLLFNRRSGQVNSLVRFIKSKRAYSIGVFRLTWLKEDLFNFLRSQILG